ncbi:unnamed protein product [Camellia sinensis]
MGIYLRKTVVCSGVEPAGDFFTTAVLLSLLGLYACWCYQQNWVCTKMVAVCYFYSLGAAWMDCILVQHSSLAVYFDLLCLLVQHSSFGF